MRLAIFTIDAVATLRLPTDKRRIGPETGRTSARNREFPALPTQGREARSQTDASLTQEHTYCLELLARAVFGSGGILLQPNSKSAVQGHPPPTTLFTLP